MIEGIEVNNNDLSVIDGIIHEEDENCSEDDSFQDRPTKQGLAQKA